MAHDIPETSWEDVTTAISAEPPVLVSSKRDLACLVVLAGGRLGEMIVIGEGLTVGRSTDADFCIPDDGVSRIHLTICRESDGTLRIVDANSRNGTYVNGQRITSATLRDGDKIYIGTRAILRFSYADRLEESFQQQMYDAALRDPLTGLFNRRHLLAQLQTEFRFSQRYGTPLSAIMIDIDHFKRVNDEHGHLVGDALLRAFGEYLRIGVRGADFAARYGGEEFVVVCRGINATGGANVASRLQRHVATLTLVEEVPELRLRFSAGVASVPHPGIQDGAELLEAADKALYAAKNGGRNCVCVYGQD